MAAVEGVSIGFSGLGLLYTDTFSYKREQQAEEWAAPAGRFTSRYPALDDGCDIRL